ncbi:chitinase [Russula compacta]|nr:chitinase [Russula compacta]
MGTMRPFVALYIILCTQLNWATAIGSQRFPLALEQHGSPLKKHPVSPRVIASSWYAGWHSEDFPISNISWNKYTSVIYAFAATTPDSKQILLDESDKLLLPQFVKTAKQHKVHPILSVGGWSGSQYFSSAVATSANRTAFAQAVMNLVSTYGVDGIEFDWEYPGNQGIGCNIVSKNDSANFLSFLKTLRRQKGAENITISAAVSLTPFKGPDGNPMSNVSEFADLLDHIEMMNYDVYGSFSSDVGPNSPLRDSCAPSPQGSAESGVKAWTDAGFPRHKILLGVAGYGHSFHVNSSSAYNSSSKIHPYVPFNKSQQPAGDKWDSTAGDTDQCGNPTVVGGIFDFWGLIDAGFLTANGTAAPGIDYTFDNCSRTPFVYNRTSQVMVSYDNARSFAAKGRFIKSKGLGGFAMWETGGDHHNILLNAIKSGVGNDNN